MSLFPVFNFVAITYKGLLVSQPVSILKRAAGVNNQNQIISQPFQPQVVNVDVDWLHVYTGQAVTFILQNSQKGGPLLDNILMAYVDNTANPANCTLIFSDSQMAVEIPAFSAGYYPVFTSQYTATLYNGTTGQIPLASVAVTTIQFCNFAVPPGTITEGISSSQYFNNQQQTKLGFVGLSAVNPSPVNLNILPAVVGTFYVISSFDVNIAGLGGVANGFVEVQFFSANQSGTPSYWINIANTDPTIPPLAHLTLGNKTGEQILVGTGLSFDMQIVYVGLTLGLNPRVVFNMSYRAILN